MGQTLPQDFTVYSLPTAHHQHMRTSNAIEHVNQKLKRRTRAVALSSTKIPLLRRISALLCEQCDEWLTFKIYPQPQNEPRPFPSRLPTAFTKIIIAQPRIPCLDIFNLRLA